ncbi:hypothetical protein ACHAXR_003448 [Thalassiosira sp. AJA248-18]
MKTAKRSNAGKGGGDPSVLDYFSKRKKKTPKSNTTSTSFFGTPATPIAHPADAMNGSETPASVISDDAVALNPSCKSETGGGGKPAISVNADQGNSSTPNMSSTTPDTNEPNTPPSPAPGSSSVAPIQGLSEREKSAIGSAQSTETPPSNDTQMTTPASPPTPATWIDCLVDQKENDCNYTKGNRSHTDKGSCSKIKEDLDTPKSLLETNDTPAQNDSQRKPQSINMGTPSTACTPSAATAMLGSSGNIRKDAVSSAFSSGKASKIRKMNQNTLISKQKTKPIKKQKQSNQLFLDFGQNSFGKQSICNICGMLGVHGLEEDDSQHAKICKEYKEGVACLGWKNERRVVTYGKDDRILEVRPEDSQQHRKKVSEVKAIVDKELGFANRITEDSSSPVANDMTSYMYISKKRVVGLLVVKRIQRAYELISSKDDGGDDDNNNNNGNNSSSSISRSLKPSKALLGIHQIWVHNSHRHRGIASKLVTAARDHLIFGMMVPLELVAFSSPTEEGLRFAKSYTASERPLIYDIH